MKLTKALFLLLLLLLSAFQAKAEEGQESECTPSFIEVSPTEPIRAVTGSWKILFKVALIGCAEELLTLTQEELETLRAEFLDPSEWSNLLLVNKEAMQELRRGAIQRVTGILGRRVATDILFHDVTILDHNVH